MVRPIDEQPVLELVEQITRIVTTHYEASAPSRSKVYELLNALAAVSAVIVAGTEDVERSSGFFLDAYRAQVLELQHDCAQPDQSH